MDLNALVWLYRSLLKNGFTVEYTIMLAEDSWNTEYDCYYPGARESIEFMKQHRNK